MPGNFTIQQFEDRMGIPIVLLSGWNANTNQFEQFRLRDLPATGILAVITWLNSLLPNNPN